MPGIFALMLHCHIPYCRKSRVWLAKNLEDINRLGDHDLSQMEDLGNPWPEISPDTFTQMAS